MLIFATYFKINIVLACRTPSHKYIGIPISIIIYEVGVGIHTKVVLNFANRFEKAFMMVHDECGGKNKLKK